MRVFVTGTDGYIGSMLAPRLVREGHEVSGFDTGYYRSGWLFTDPAHFHIMPRSICADIREVTPRDAGRFRCGRTHGGTFQ